MPACQVAALKNRDYVLEEYKARLAKNNFWEYRKQINPKLKDGAWQREVAGYLQKFVEDLIAGKAPVLIIQAPPQHGKSVQIIDLLTWIAGKHPEIRQIFSSFSERLGIRANLRIRRIMQSDKYKRIFPGVQLPTPADKDYSMNREFIEFVGEEGSFRNTTVGGQINGESLDLGIIDDPMKGREAANSPVIREKTWDWFADDFFTRFSETAGMLIVGTRWHIDDPIGRFIETKPKNLTVLKYPAIAVVDDIPNPLDKLKTFFRKIGDALFPELKSIPFLMERKKIQGTANFEALYQQSPIIEGGNVFLETWWRYYDILPKIRYSILVGDTAQKTEERHDFSVFMIWGMGEDGNAYLIDILRGKWEAPQLKTNFIAFWNKHRANPALRLRSAHIEDKSSGTGLIQSIKQKDKIPIKGVKRDTKDKYTRATSVSPRVEAGYVYLKKDAHWLSDFLYEVTIFDGGAKDDQVDCVSDGLDILFNHNNDFKIRSA